MEIIRVKNNNQERNLNKKANIFFKVKHLGHQQGGNLVSQGWNYLVESSPRKTNYSNLDNLIKRETFSQSYIK